MAKSVVDALLTVQPQLPPSEKRVADLILSAPVEAMAFPARDLAERAGVSNSAVSRLVQRLGFQDWASLRKAAAQPSAGSPAGLRTKRLPPENRTIGHHLQVETENLSRTLEAVHPLMLGAVASALGSARQVHIVGFRNSRVLAAYAHLQLRQMRDGVIAMPPDGQTPAESLAGIAPDDTVLAIGLRRRPAGFVRMVEEILSTGASVALMTDDPNDPLAAAVRWTFAVQVGGSGELDSYTGALSLLNLLMTRTLAASPKQAEERLARIEDMHRALGDLERR